MAPVREAAAQPAQPARHSSSWVIPGLHGSGLLGQRIGASLAFATAGTIVWEYAVEVWNSQPSTFDLLWTPLGGALLGELRYVTWEAAGSLPRTARDVVRALVDPFGELERALGAGC